MTDLRVVNTVKDRSKVVRPVAGGTYEWGWLAVNKRDRTKDYFNKVGEGTMDEGLAWMSATGYVAKRITPLASGPG